MGAARQALVPIAAELHWVHVAGTPSARLSGDAFAQPHCHLMAALALAARLCYRLDGGARAARVPGVPPPPPDWQAWAAGALAGLRQQCDFPLAADEARPGMPSMRTRRAPLACAAAMVTCMAMHERWPGRLPRPLELVAQQRRAAGALVYTCCVCPVTDVAHSLALAAASARGWPAASAGRRGAQA
jgi:hypothetical protein